MRDREGECKEEGLFAVSASTLAPCYDAQLTRNRWQRNHCLFHPPPVCVQTSAQGGVHKGMRRQSTACPAFVPSVSQPPTPAILSAFLRTPCPGRSVRRL